MQIISDHQKQLIQANYSQWLESNGYQARRSQREMIAIIARMLAGITVDAEGLRADESMQHVSLIEAGTGTGKTIAYALPAIAMALELDKKLVISTATINLQEQLVNVDLPNLQANTSLDFKYALAKGRQRYLCLNKLKLRLQDVSRAAGDLTLFPDEESSLADATVVQLEALDQHYLGGRWDGDQDSLEHEISYEDWRLVAADRASCSGKKCVHYSNCALFKARDDLRTADVVVANHDLVLADLAMGGANILPPPEQSIFVFDEAHHLPSKSRNHLSAHMSLASERSHVLQTKKVLARIAATKGAPSELKGLQKNLQTIDSGLQSSLENIGYTLQELLNNDEQLADQGSLRFANGEVPSELHEAFQDLADCYRHKQGQLQRLADICNGKLGAGDEASSSWEVHFGAVGQLEQNTDNALKVCLSYAGTGSSKSPSARWLQAQERVEGIDITINMVPLSTATILADILWSKCFAAILTSATLAPLGDFNHFMRRIGHQQAGSAHRINGQLNFQDAEFYVPVMHSHPGSAAAHTEEVIRLLPKLLADAQGALVLFSSRQQMEAVQQGLKGQLTQQLLVQGRSSKQALIQQHKATVDGGSASVIFGLASFAEGLDLPGDYCTQVVIAKLPFSVPTDPVDVAMGEWIEANGGNAFADISLPETSMRLMQACGRLLRKETDTGRVTLLDKRIVSKYYGKQLIRALPPFKLVLPNTQ